MDFTDKERLLIGFFARTEARKIRDTTAASPAHNETRANRLMACDSIVAKLAEGDKPITAEWLESLGATDQGFPYPAYTVYIRDETVWFDIRFLDVLLIRLNILHRAVDIDIKPRREFVALYRLLAGKELGE